MADSPPPLPTTSSSSPFNLSPIQYFLCLAALISIPSLIYLFLFAIRHTSFSLTITTRASSSSISSVSGSLSKSNFTCRGKIVSSDNDCFEEAKANYRECPVCLSGFDGREPAKQLSVCKHAFHASCIDAWLDSTGNTCPICRASIGHKKKATKDPLPDSPEMVRATEMV